MSISNAIRHTLGTTKAPMTVAEINKALGGKDCTANIHNLVQRGQIRRVGKQFPARYTLPDTTPAANDSSKPTGTPSRPLAPSLGLGASAPAVPAEANARPECEAVPTPTRAAPPHIEEPLPPYEVMPCDRPPETRAQSRISFPSDTALRLIALALSAPALLEKADRELIAETIHSISDQLPA